MAVITNNKFVFLSGLEEEENFREETKLVEDTNCSILVVQDEAAQLWQDNLNFPVSSNVMTRIVERAPITNKNNLDIGIAR